MSNNNQVCQVKFNKSKVPFNDFDVKFNLTMKESFGESLKALREKRGLTQDQLADASGVTKSTVSLYENDKVVQPRFNTIEKLARPLGLTKEELRQIAGEKLLLNAKKDTIPPKFKALFQNSDKWSTKKELRVYRHLELLIEEDEDGGEEFESQ